MKAGHSEPAEQRRRRLLIDAKGRITLKQGFEPPVSPEIPYRQRAELYNAAKAWAREAIEGAERRASRKEAALIRCCARDTLSALESLHLVRSYIRAVNRSKEVSEILMAANLPAVMAKVIRQEAERHALRFDYVHNGRRVPPWRVDLRRFGNRLRELGYLLWLIFFGSRRAMNDLPDEVVLVEAGSIQSVRSTARVVALLHDTGIPTTLLGLQKFPPWLKHRAMYNPRGISSVLSAESSPSRAVVNLLEYVPLGARIRVFGRFVWRFVLGTGSDWSGAPVDTRDSGIDGLHRLLNRTFLYDFAVAELGRSAVRELVKLARPRGFVVTDITNSCGRSAAAFEDCGVPVVLIQDGIVSNEQCRWFARDAFSKAVVWGEPFADLVCHEFGWSPEKVVITGPHRLERRPLDRSGTRSGMRLLLISQPWDDSGYDPEELIGWLGHAIGREPRWEARLRPHPRQQPTELVAAAPPSIHVLEDRAPLVTDLAWATVVVGQYSTALLEAGLHGIPIVAVDNGVKTDLGFFGRLIPDCVVTDQAGFMARLRALDPASGSRSSLLDHQRQAFGRLLKLESDPIRQIVEVLTTELVSCV